MALQGLQSFYHPFQYQSYNGETLQILVSIFHKEFATFTFTHLNSYFLSSNGHLKLPIRESVVDSQPTENRECLKAW